MSLTRKSPTSAGIHYLHLFLFSLPAIMPTALFSPICAKVNLTPTHPAERENRPPSPVLLPHQFTMSFKHLTCMTSLLTLVNFKISFHICPIREQDGQASGGNDFGSDDWIFTIREKDPKKLQNGEGQSGATDQVRQIIL